MGKKMGMNSKAVAAKERKNEKAASEKAAKDAAIEDAKWVDDNKQLAKKQVEIETESSGFTKSFTRRGKKMLRRRDWKLWRRRRRERTCWPRRARTLPRLKPRPTLSR